MIDGHYKTANGSEMWISKNGGVSRVSFDWCDEPGACCDCSPEPYHDEGYLVWHCDEHESGRAKLTLVEENDA